MNILITKFKTHGDVLLLTPLIKNLRLNLPKAKIDVLLDYKYESILQNNPHINKIISFYKTSSYGTDFLYFIKLIHKIRKNKYDIFISTDRGDRSALISFLSAAKKRIGRPDKEIFFHRFAFDDHFYLHNERHVIDLNLDPLRILQLRIFSKGLDLYHSEEDWKNVSGYLSSVGKFVHIHPVSLGMYKCLNSLAVAKIIDFIEFNLRLKTVITSSNKPEELNEVGKILNQVRSNPINLSGKLSIPQLSTLNKMSVLTISVDTLISHIASANDVPTIIFFGPTAVNNWGPWDKNYKINRYLKSGGNQSFGKHTVVIQEKNCIPCSKIGCNDSGLSECLIYDDISKIEKYIKEKLACA